jgi:chaperonin GroEL (HSP60 family)
LDEEEKSIKNMIEKIIESEANVLFCQKGIDDFAQYLLAKNGIYACRRISKSDMLKLSKATGSKIVSNLNEINSDILGKANEVKEIITSGEKMTYVQGCINPHAVTILIRGGSLHVIEEIERAIMDALGDLISTLKTGLIVSGGGASEIELSLKLKEYSKEVGGREGMAILEFANSLEFILITLAENAGLDPIDVLTEVKRKHNQGEKHIGLNLFNDKIENVFNARILDPYKVKSQALSSANDVATMILRIDDIIAAKTNKTPEDISNYLKSLD